MILSLWSLTAKVGSILFPRAVRFSQEINSNYRSGNVKANVVPLPT